MTLEEFDYVLPENLIAQEPLADRSASRLLHLDRTTGCAEHLRFLDSIDLLHEGDLLVLNDTRVTSRRLTGNRATGAKVEALVMNRTGELFRALVRPAKKLKTGESIKFEGGIEGTIVEDLGEGQKLIQFSPGSVERLARSGAVPLPPYVRRALEDEERYQTVYAASPGSSAAPTAGLHFTTELLAALQAKGIETATVTLDVGIDTFRPVAVDCIEEHQMHGESCTVPVATCSAIEQCKGRIIAVGTTTVRTLESFATGKRKVQSGTQVSRLFIRPGFSFQVVDGMFTNFHLPRTTMLMMISALAGREAVSRAYAEAVAGQYRFLSFGDSMLIV